MDYKLLKNYRGFADPSVRFQDTKGPSQHGSTLLDTHLDPKEMSFDIMIMGTDLTDLQAKNAALITALNPLNGAGYLFFTYENGIQYYRKCINSGGPALDLANATQTRVKATINLMAHDPFWMGSTETISLQPQTTSWIPWMGYTDASAGLWVISGTGSTVPVTNNGDHSIPVKLIIYGGTGSITDCRITNNETGEYIEISGLIDTGESFEINTDENVLSAIKTDAAGTESNGYPHLAVTSKFWYLIPGTNSISISASNAVAGSYVTLTKTEKYVGR